MQQQCRTKTKTPNVTKRTRDGAETDAGVGCCGDDGVGCCETTSGGKKGTGVEVPG